MSKIKDLSVFGPFKDPTGYAHVVRGFTKSLYERGYIVGLHDFSEWSGINIPIDSIYDNMEEVGKVKHSDTMLAFCLPEQLRHKELPFRQQTLLNYTMFEADGINEEWAYWSTMCDAVVVPTQFNKEGWINSGVNPERIFVVPIGVDMDLFRSDDSVHFDLGTDLFDLMDFENRFLNIQEISERKNVNTLIKAFMEATRGLERTKACLVLKLSSYSENRLDYFGERIDKIRKSINIKQEEHCPVFVYGELLEDKQIPALMRQFTHYVSASRGEGWDMTCAAMASLGKQIVVPDHTAYPEYLKHAHFVPAKKVPCNQRGSLNRLYDNLNWFEVDYDEMVNTIRDSIKGKKHESNTAHMEEFYTWDKCTDQLVKVLDNVRGDKLIKRRNYKKKDNVLMVGCKSYGTKCGIGDYTKNLCNEMGQTRDIGMMVGDDYQWMDHIDNNGPSIFHLQYEYQFHNPARLSHLLRCAKTRGIKTVVTQHTLNPEARKHNEVISEYADKILVHSQLSADFAHEELGYGEGKIEIVPMGIDTAKPKPLIDDARIAKSKFKIGFFGFSYYHKGIDTLINTMEENRDAMYVFFASKPQQDQVKYYEQCRAILDKKGYIEREDYWWFHQYVDEEEVVQYLADCDLIVLPYKDYGGVGTSAAISTVLRARKPVIVSNTCWFDHVPKDVVYKCNLFDKWSLADTIGDVRIELKNKEKLNKRIESIEKFVQDNSWENAAKCHEMIYKNL